MTTHRNAVPSTIDALPEPGLPPPENKQFYPALDGLRAIAVLMVFWQHYFGEFYPPLSWGWSGVDIFFVLSGFLITGILYDTRETAKRVRNFYMRRTLRIFPLYYGVLLAALLSTPIFHWFWNRAWVLWFLYLGNYVPFIFMHSPLQTMGGFTGVLVHLRSQPVTPNSPSLLLGHFWSLCVEEQFYLLWPALVFTVRSRTVLRNICLLSVPLVLATRILCTLSIPRAYLHANLLYEATPLRCDALLLGGFAALALRGPEGDRLLRSAPKLLWLALTGFLVWEAIYRFFVGAFYHPVAGAPVLYTIGFTLLDVAALALILSVLSPRHPLARMMSLAPLRFLGRISYGFYIFHDIFHLDVIRGMQRFVGRETFRFDRLTYGVVNFALALLLATLSYYFFEARFLKLKVRFAPSQPAGDGRTTCC